MCDKCSAVVGEYKRQSYRLRVMLLIERRGYYSGKLNHRALQAAAYGFKNRVPAGTLAMTLCANPEMYGLEKSYANNPDNS